MTIHLPEELESSVQAEVRNGHFASADDAVIEIVREYFRNKTPDQLGQPTSPPSPRKPLWERAAELRSSIPEEEWDKLPADGAEQLDHYLHGAPKRPTS